MNGRTIAGIGLVVLGLGLVVLGGYNLALAGGNSSPSPSPVTTASAAPSADPSPTASPAPTPTAAPTVAPSPAPVPTPSAEPSATVGTAADAAVRAFLADLVAAIRAGNTEVMGARLNGATIDRYGVAACEAKLASDQPDPGYAIDIIEIHPLGPWDYTTDDRTTTIAEAWTVDARVTAQGETATRPLHIAPMDGGVSWFTDCGDPLPAP